MAVESIGKMLLYIGILLVLAGGFFMLAAKVPWFGKLPGDIIYKREGLTIFVPITTMIIVSLVLTFLLNIIWRR
ncbi:MAG: DUF2905 domain-containing protein [Candidatus Margulisbacteria bacterium]|nr:DUF2905 domain-containing protein [Candidatus Margulisiibacteriota bacterium]